jgi:hypothetical protein
MCYTWVFSSLIMNSLILQIKNLEGRNKDLKGRVIAWDGGSGLQGPEKFPSR